MKWILTIATCLSYLTLSFSQIIETIGTGLTMQGQVEDIAFDPNSNRAYIVGDISSVDGIPVRDVFKMEYGTVTAIPDQRDINGTVLCAEVHAGDLYIGGYFTIESADPIYNIAKLENGSWKGLGLDKEWGAVTDLHSFDGDLYACGSFISSFPMISDGAMVYREGQWTSSGLDSDFTVVEFLSKGDTLTVYGSYQSDSGGDPAIAHLIDESWRIVPDTDGRGFSSCVYLGDQLLCYGRWSDLQRFDWEESAWDSIYAFDLRVSGLILLTHDDNLYAAGEDGIVFKVSVSLASSIVDVEEIDLGLNGEILCGGSYNGTLLLGGDFIDFGSPLMSLAALGDNGLRPMGSVASTTTYRDSRNNTGGNSIWDYRGKLLVAGDFTFADGTYSPQLAYYEDGMLLPFEVQPPSYVNSLAVFEDSIYAIVIDQSPGPGIRHPRQLSIYRQGSWQIIADDFSANRLRVIDGKLFPLERWSASLDNGLIPYLKSGTWQYLQGPTEFDRLNFIDLIEYQDGLLLAGARPEGLFYSAGNSDSWQLINTYDVGSPERIYDVNGEVILFDRDLKLLGPDSLIDVDLDVNFGAPVFFSIDHNTYFSDYNAATYLWRRSDSISYFNGLRINDVEHLENGDYLVAGFGASSIILGSEREVFRGLGIWKSTRPSGRIVQASSEICKGTYLDLSVESDVAGLEMRWYCDGGNPAFTTSKVPEVQYSEVGDFPIRLVLINPFGDSTVVEGSVSVSDCDNTRQSNHQYDNHWISGRVLDRALQGGIGGFDFTLTDSIMLPRHMAEIELASGATVMSNEKGVLQYYSNGRAIRNMQHKAIQGSACFNDDMVDYPLDRFIANQSIMSIPAINTSDEYWVFDMDYTSVGQFYGAASNLSITKIDMSANDGLGAVTVCNEDIIDDTLLNSTMQATRHANGEDWWIVVGKYDSDEYYSILLTEDGVSEVKLSSWDRYYDQTFSGQSVFSPDGQYFAQVVTDEQSVQMWRFDNSTGILSDRTAYNIAPSTSDDNPYGCAFSPNSRFLYVTSLTHLRQIDLCNYEDLDVELIDVWDGTIEFVYRLYFGRQMLTPDQRIIIVPYGNGHRLFSIINAPNEKGEACRFDQHSLQADPLATNGGNDVSIFPHFRQYPSYTGDCSTVSTTSISSDAEKFAVYPNPVSGNGMLHFNTRTSGEVYDVLGRHLHSFSMTDYLDVHNLPNGTYIIVTDMGSQVVVKGE